MAIYIYTHIYIYKLRGRLHKAFLLRVSNASESLRALRQHAVQVHAFRPPTVDTKNPS